MPHNKMPLGKHGLWVAENILLLRRRQRMSQRELAERVGATRGRSMGDRVVSATEAGARRIDVDDLVAFAVALEVTVAELVGEDPQ